MTDIQTKGCPDGIEAIDMTSMTTWVFEIAVLGEETIYRVCSYFSHSYSPEQHYDRGSVPVITVG